MSSDDITISWIRHGESMAQMMENAIDDQYKNENDKQDFQEYRIKVKTEEIEQYRIDDFSKKIKEAYDAFKQSKEDKIDINKQLVFWDKTKDEVVNNFINDKIFDEGELVDFAYEYAKLTPASWFLTPTLTYAGKMQAERLGITYISKKYKANNTLFICSPTVRTIMTALYALQKSGIEMPTIHIVPYINEKGMDTYYLDRANAGIPYEIIDDVIEMIKKYIGIENIHVETTNYIETAKTALEKRENIYLGDFIAAKIHIKKLLDGKKKVAAFVHANFIISRIEEATGYKFPKKEFPINCNVYDLKYDATIHPEPIASIEGILAYKGGVRKEGIIGISVDIEEKHIDFSSLKKGELRGDINKKWIKCYDIKNGDYKCGDVLGLKEHFSQKGGKRKTKRRNKKYTNKKRRVTRKKTKRNLRRRRR